MGKNNLDQLKFLENQLQWCKVQESNLQELESKLLEMKTIAENALKPFLSALELTKLNQRLNELKKEVHSLEKQLNTVLH